ncbi:MAG: ATP-dependent DNA helicase RecQ [Spirochaetaceae bacterium]|nr:MAG: ATP-dependent DNA helicase RecQ [Spirochaetaceae bacterium]
MEHALPDPMLDVARTHFGIDYLFPYQRLVVANTLDADRAAPDGPATLNQMVILPTGSGKTLCFSLPALLIDRPTLVVYPLLALMSDQARRAAAAGIATAVLKGGMPAHERNAAIAGVADGSIRLVITNPEMLERPEVRRALAAADIGHLVVDEAHCVSEWGQSFRPSYLRIGDAIAEIAPRVATAFTATASPPVLDAIRRLLFGDAPVALINGNPDRPNIAYTVMAASSPLASLRLLLTGACPVVKPAIVFCSSRARTESLAVSAGVSPDCVGAYHAGLDREERSAIERWFFSTTEAVLFATCAYGMGVDKPDIRTVIHYDLPASVEAFLQESGRAGRDGAPAESIVLTDSTGPSVCDDPRRALFAGYLTAPGCRRDYLLDAMSMERQTCFSCDRCRARDATEYAPAAAVAEVEGRIARRVHAAIAAQPRRFTIDELLRTVRARPEEFEQIVRAMVDRGELVPGRRGPWRNRLSAGVAP